jgi:hypothetical protein
MPAIEEVTLPNEVLEQLKMSDETPSVARLDAIGQWLEKSKQEAIGYRTMSGIEDTWALCEDSYAGIDDANRGEHHANRWVKPTTMDAPIQTRGHQVNQTDIRSNAFVRMTTRYVDAGSAKVGEILLPIDGKAFSFAPTPVPDMIKGEGDKSQVIDPQLGALEREQTPEELKASGQPIDPNRPPPKVPLTYDDLAKEVMAKATRKAKLAETQVFDWMVECQHPFEMRKVIFDSARLGVGVIKGPYPDLRKRMAIVNGKLEIKYDVVPVDKWVSPWNIYPDPACGEDIRNGDFIWERDFFSERQVRALIGVPGYIEGQIKKVLAAGPTKGSVETKNPMDVDRKNPYVVWFYHGTMDKADFETINPTAVEGELAEKVHVIVTMINDIVIRGALNPLSSGELPYHAVPWIRRPNFWAGTGVAEQLFTPQRIVNAATRAILNNAGISAGPQIIINQRGIKPANNDWRIFSNKIWYLTEEGSVDDIRKAFYSVDIANVGDSIYKIVEYGMRLAEESTSIPLVTQGMSGKTTPDTLGATQLQDNNANQLLRYIGYSFDGYVTVRLVNQYYEYLLLDPNVDDEKKGEFMIHAQGSVALVERAIQDQTIAQMTPLAQDPQFGVNPKKWFAILAKSKRLDPAEFQYTKDEQAAIDSQPKPQPPAIEVAKIKAQTAQMQMQLDQKRAQEEDALARELAQIDAEVTMQTEKLRNDTQQLKVKLDTDRDTAFVQSEMGRARADYEYNMGKLALEKEIKTLDFAIKNKMAVEAVKAKLADTVMKVNAQKELAMMDAKLRVHEHTTPSGTDLMKPAVQLPGKAGQGKAASQV